MYDIASHLHCAIPAHNLGKRWCAHSKPRFQAGELITAAYVAREAANNVPPSRRAAAFNWRRTPLCACARPFLVVFLVLILLIL